MRLPPPRRATPGALVSFDLMTTPSARTVPERASSAGSVPGRQPWPSLLLRCKLNTPVVGNSAAATLAMTFSDAAVTDGPSCAAKGAMEGILLSAPSRCSERADPEASAGRHCCIAPRQCDTAATMDHGAGGSLQGDRVWVRQIPDVDGALMLSSCAVTLPAADTRSSPAASAARTALATLSGADLDGCRPMAPTAVLKTS